MRGEDAMSTGDRPDTPTVLQGAYACDLAPDGDGRAFGAWAASDWAEESLFAARSNQRGGGWQLAPSHDERDFMARLGAARYRVYAGQLAGDYLEPVELTESPTVIQDPTVAAYGDRRLVAWGERIDNRFVVRAWTGADPETVASAPASLTRPAAAIDTDGQPWVAWQAFDGDGCVVVVSRRQSAGWTPPVVASVAGQSAWRPARARFSRSRRVAGLGRLDRSPLSCVCTAHRTGRDARSGCPDQRPAAVGHGRGRRRGC